MWFLQIALWPAKLFKIGNVYANALHCDCCVCCSQYSTAMTRGDFVLMRSQFDSRLFEVWLSSLQFPWACGFCYGESRTKILWCILNIGWLGSRVVSVLDSGAEGPGFKSQPRRWCNSLRQTVHTHCASVHQAAKLVAALLRVAVVIAGLAESNGSIPPGLWLTSPAGWLPRTGISSGTLRSVIEYGLHLPFTF